MLITEHGPRSWEVLSVPRTELLNLLRAFPAYLNESGISAEMVARMSQSRERVPVLVLHADGETIELDFVSEDDLRTVAVMQAPAESLFGAQEVADA